MTDFSISISVSLSIYLYIYLCLYLGTFSLFSVIFREKKNAVVVYLYSTIHRRKLKKKNNTQLLDLFTVTLFPHFEKSTRNLYFAVDELTKLYWTNCIWKSTQTFYQLIALTEYQFKFNFLLFVCISINRFTIVRCETNLIQNKEIERLNAII